MKKGWKIWIIRYKIRRQHVMLDQDLAEVKQFDRQVKDFQMISCFNWQMKSILMLWGAKKAPQLEWVKEGYVESIK